MPPSLFSHPHSLPRDPLASCRPQAHPYASTAPRRLPLDPSLRRLFYGPIRPMDEPGLLAKVLHALRRL